LPKEDFDSDLKLEEARLWCAFNAYGEELAVERSQLPSKIPNASTLQYSCRQISACT
jgi:hypothetical protein